METAAWFLLSNFTINLLIVGLVASGISLLRWPRPWSSAAVVEALLSYFVLFSIGVSYVLNFVMHVFFSEMTAGFIGWADSPFQKEVGFASLGFALLGFLAFRGSFDMRLAAVLGPSAFLWGAALVHLRDMMSAANYAPSNAGAVFYTDVFVPIIGLTLVWLQHRLGQDSRSSRAGPMAPSR